MNISVVIPVFNRPALVARAIDSVLAQRLPPDEIIVVNDGSTDDTADVLKRYGDAIEVLHQTNGGVSAARNRGIAHAGGEWIALLDSDDCWHPEKLRMQSRFHEENPSLLWSHTYEAWIRNGRVVRQKKMHAKGEGACFAENLAFCKIAPSTVMIHRSLFSRYGDFDETLPVCEDYDLWLRFLKHEPVGLVREVLTTKFAGHAQLSESGYLLDHYRIEALMKHAGVSDVRREINQKVEILRKGARKHRNGEILAFCERVVNRLNQFD